MPSRTLKPAGFPKPLTVQVTHFVRPDALMLGRWRQQTECGVYVLQADHALYPTCPRCQALRAEYHSAEV